MIQILLFIENLLSESLQSKRTTDKAYQGPAVWWRHAQKTWNIVTPSVVTFNSCKALFFYINYLSILATRPAV